MTYKEIGAFAYYIKNKKLMVVLVTNSSGRQWILPKGHIETDLSRKQVALTEAYEEAGIIGNIAPFGYKEISFKRKERNICLRVYPVKIKKVLNKWPEWHSRERVVLPAEKAASVVHKKALSSCIKFFSDEILTRPALVA